MRQLVGGSFSSACLLRGRERISTKPEKPQERWQPCQRWGTDYRLPLKRACAAEACAYELTHPSDETGQSSRISVPRQDWSLSSGQRLTEHAGGKTQFVFLVGDPKLRLQY